MANFPDIKIFKDACSAYESFIEQCSYTVKARPNIKENNITVEVGKDFLNSLQESMLGDLRFEEPTEKFPRPDTAVIEARKWKWKCVVMRSWMGWQMDRFPILKQAGVPDLRRFDPNKYLNRSPFLKRKLPAGPQASTSVPQADASVPAISEFPLQLDLSGDPMNLEADAFPADRNSVVSMDEDLTDEIELTYRNLKNLPADFLEKYRKMTVVNLTGNLFETVPDELSRMPNLEVLFLLDNKKLKRESVADFLRKLAKNPDFFEIHFDPEHEEGLKGVLEEINGLPSCLITSEKNEESWIVTLDKTEDALSLPKLDLNAKRGPEDSQLARFRELNFYNHSLRDLPEWFSKMVNLTSLNLDCNQFVSIPLPLYSMHWLEGLYLLENDCLLTDEIIQYLWDIASYQPESLEIHLDLHHAEGLKKSIHAIGKATHCNITLQETQKCIVLTLAAANPEKRRKTGVSLFKKI